MPMERTARIAALNDQLRATLKGGLVLITAGVVALGVDAQAAILAAVAAYDRFTPESDPYGEHDFGVVAIAGERLFWKIDYLDRAEQAHSPDPSDPALTVRTLTIMLAAEY